LLVRIRHCGYSNKNIVLFLIVAVFLCLALTSQKSAVLSADSQQTKMLHSSELTE